MAYNYDRRRVTGAAPNTYMDDLDAGFIAQQVVQYGKSTGWAVPQDPMQHHLAQQIEQELSKFNIGIVDHNVSTWGHKPGGSHVFAHLQAVV